MAGKHNINYRLIIGLMFLVCDVQAGMIDKDGMAPWEICGMCHSADGISRMSKFPILAGQKATYLKSQMLDFRQGRRLNDGGQMSSIVTEVDPATIDGIVGYFAGLSGPIMNLVVQPGVDQVAYEAGRLLFEEGRAGAVACNVCHNDGHPAAPRLRAQHAAYLRKQLNDFKYERRVSEGATVMTSIAKLLTENEIDSISVYLHSSGSYDSDVAH
jgi:cytochrome c553